MLKDLALPQCVSFINLKGGVGKTTLAVNIAANLAQYHKKKVLLVDLDPQTNSTISLISPKNYLILKENKKTLKILYDNVINNKKFNVNEIIHKNIGNIRDLQLLASDLELIDIDVKLSNIPNNHAIIYNSFQDIFSTYDYVIFDCPPNLGLLTQNGLFASDYYVVPVQPDFLSTFGLELIIGRIEWFRRRMNKGFTLKYGGLIFSRVRHTNEHQQKMIELRSKKDYNPVFKTPIYERTAISEAASLNLPICLSKSGFGWKDVDEMFKTCTQEFLDHTQPKE